eukprot:SAG22_NODE_1805_length_3533_cov_1.343040_3_plen_498_part_00
MPWVLDKVVDLFFIIDVFVQARTSFYDSNGFRENRPGKIFRKYLSGWFLIDVASCLPLDLIQYMGPAEKKDAATTTAAAAAADGDDQAAGGTEVRALKVMRLMKLTKMLRLGRLKRILAARFGSAGNDMYKQWFGIAGTVFLIVLIAHMLACFFYHIGDSDGQTLGSEWRVQGWVELEDGWTYRNGSVVTTEPEDCTNIEGKLDCRIGLSTRYLTSMYYVLNALEHGYTSAERGYGVFAELIRDVILGLVAGLITTIAMSLSQSDHEADHKLARLAKWMETKKLPKPFRVRASQHFTKLWGDQSALDLKELLAQCPPAMATNLADLLFGRYLAMVPLFKGLSAEVISALCLKCQPMSAMQGSVIIAEGEPGQEMYVLSKGEVEVSEKRQTGNPDSPVEIIRLGFLSEGAFFGEAPLLGRTETSLELRMRTVTAVQDCECFFLTRGAIHSLYGAYPELRARMTRFETTGRVLDDQVCFVFVSFRFTHVYLVRPTSCGP